ncbi:18259_t:CDS:2 [Rhizophagus irregularis]|nr:18259_t:CDS:2 [Rhizophagus irregularis]
MTVGSMNNIPFIFVEEGITGGRPASSRNKAARKKMLNNRQPQINIPFPPTITIAELLTPKKNCIKSKAPNCFMIYRQNYVRELQNQKLSYAMTDISGFISDSWKNESPNVVEFYKNLAQEANKQHKQKYGTVPVPPHKNESKIQTPQISDDVLPAVAQNNYDYFQEFTPYQCMPYLFDEYLPLCSYPG